MAYNNREIIKKDTDGFYYVHYLNTIELSLYEMTEREVIYIFRFRKKQRTKNRSIIIFCYVACHSDMVIILSGLFIKLKNWGIVMIFGIALIVVAFLLIIVEIKASNKRKILNTARNIVCTEFKSKKNLENKISKDMGDALVLGGGSGILSILDVYHQIDNHEHVLNVLEQRCPNTLDDLTPVEWFSKLENMSRKPAAYNSYINLFKGQEGENIALNMLHDHGMDAHLYSTLNHPNDDIFVTLGNNTEVPYSVKCGSVQYIKQQIDAHSDSHNYIINSEAYDTLQNTGALDDYAHHGIKIIDGGFSNADLTSMGDSAFSDIVDAGDVSDDIPVVGLALFGYKTFNNVRTYCKGDQSSHELKVNMTVDAIKAGSGGIAGIAGAKAGGIVGTLVCPGVGTIIGGVIGAFGGAIAGGRIFNWAKEQFKWGKIIDAIDYFGMKYASDLSFGMRNIISYRLLNTYAVDKRIAEESILAQKYNKELNPYSWIKPSVSAVVSQEYLAILKATRERIDNSLTRFQQELDNLCQQYAMRMYPNSANDHNKTKRRLLGDIILSNQWILGQEQLAEKENMLISGYNNQSIEAPNHPYRIKDSGEIFKQLIYNCYFETDVTAYSNAKNYGTFLYIFSAIFLLVGGFIIFAHL